MIAPLKAFFRPPLLLPRDIVLTIVGILIGTLFGWLITHLYYLQSERDSIVEAKERKRVEELIFRGIESVGTIRYTRDTSGRVVGVIIELKGSAVANSTATGTLSSQ
jgi:hypothetical protein